MAAPADVLRLQRLLGNRATESIIQAKLEVGLADDAYEREADRVAIEMTGPTATRSPQPSPVQRMQLDDLRTERAAPEAGFEAGPALEGRVAANRGGGQPLPDTARSDLEPKFGADFSEVRVHTGGEAAQLNRALSARAFTHGHDIYFGQSQFNPGTGAGKQLLAHELTHVVQQGHGSRDERGGAGVQRKPLAAEGISAGQVAPGSRLQLARGEKGRFGGSALGSLISTPLFGLGTAIAPLLGLVGGAFMGAKTAGKKALGKQDGQKRKWKDASGWRKFGAVMAGIGGGIAGGIAGAIGAPIVSALMAIPGVAGMLASEMTFGFSGERHKAAKQDVQPNNPLVKVNHISIQGDNYVLRGRKYEPGTMTQRKRDDQLPGRGKRIVLLSGSGGPNENQLSDVGEFYAKQGATVYAVNYRGFGSGEEGSRDVSGGRESSPLMSESGLYADAYRIYQFARNDGGTVPASKIIVHGFSLGGAIASNLVKRVKQQDGESLGGLVLHSSIKSAYAAARDMIGLPGVAQAGGAVTHLGAGGFNTPEALEEIARIDPDLPLHMMSGSGGHGDQLALSETGMTEDWAKGLGFQNVTSGEGSGGHLATGRHLYSSDDQLKALLGANRPEPQPETNTEEEPQRNVNPLSQEQPQWTGMNPLFQE